MKRIAIGALLSLIITSVSAQNLSTNKFGDATSESILKTLQTKYGAYTSARINFTMQGEKKQKITSQLQGVLVVSGSKYRLKVDQQEVFCDGKTIWTYLIAQKEVTIADFDPSDQEQFNPFELLKQYHKSYRSAFIREEIQKGICLQLIDLYPLKESSLSRVRLFIDKSKKQISKIVLTEKDGMSYHYFVDKFSVNEKIDATYFVFVPAKYPNVDLIDLR